MAQQTALDYFKDELIKEGFFIPGGIYAQAKAMEKQQRMQDYNVGYTDAACNHVNDAENYLNEISYMNDENTTH